MPTSDALPLTLRAHRAIAHSLPIAQPARSLGGMVAVMAYGLIMLVTPMACGAAISATREAATPKEMRQAEKQIATYMKANHLPGSIETGVEEDYRLAAHEVMVIVDSQQDLEVWARVSEPFQLAVVKGIHDHAGAKPITDAVRYVVIRQDGAEGVIGGAKRGAVQPIINGWVVWVRFYPEGHTIFSRPTSDKDLIPGRANSLHISDRPGQRPMTGSFVPHQQLTQVSPPEVRAALMDWMKTAFPHTITGRSKVSDSSSFALHLDGVEFAPHVRGLTPIHGAHEFGHLHEDGSMHLALSPEDRWEVIAKGWGEPHPGARWGINAIMVYAPRNVDELEVAKKAFTASYRYAIGEVTE